MNDDEEDEQAAKNGLSIEALGGARKVRKEGGVLAWRLWSKLLVCFISQAPQAVSRLTHTIIRYRDIHFDH